MTSPAVASPGGKGGLGGCCGCGFGSSSQSESVCRLSSESDAAESSEDDPSESPPHTQGRSPQTQTAGNAATWPEGRAGRTGDCAGFDGSNSGTKPSFALPKPLLRPTGQFSLHSGGRGETVSWWCTHIWVRRATIFSFSRFCSRRRCSNAASLSAAGSAALRAESGALFAAELILAFV